MSDHISQTRDTILSKAKDQLPTLLFALPTFGVMISWIFENINDLSLFKAHQIFRAFAAFYFLLPLLLILVWYTHTTILSDNKRYRSDLWRQHRFLWIIGLPFVLVLLCLLLSLIPAGWEWDLAGLLVAALAFIGVSMLLRALYTQEASKEKSATSYPAIAIAMVGFIAFVNFLLPWLSWWILALIIFPLLGAFLVVLHKNNQRAFALPAIVLSGCILLCLPISGNKPQVKNPDETYALKALHEFPSVSTATISSGKGYRACFEYQDDVRKNRDSVLKKVDKIVRDYENISVQWNTRAAKDSLYGCYGCIRDTLRKISNTLLDSQEHSIASMKIKNSDITEKDILRFHFLLSGWQRTLQNQYAQYREVSQEQFFPIVAQVRLRGIGLFIGVILLLLYLRALLNKKEEDTSKEKYSLQHTKPGEIHSIDYTIEKGTANTTKETQVHTVDSFIVLLVLLLIPLLHIVKEEDINPDKPLWMLNMPYWYLPAFVDHAVQDIPTGGGYSSQTPNRKTTQGIGGKSSDIADFLYRLDDIDMRMEKYDENNLERFRELFRQVIETEAIGRHNSDFTDSITKSNSNADNLYQKSFKRYFDRRNRRFH